MAPLPTAGPLASALGVGGDDTVKPRVAVSTRPPMNQAWTAVVSGQRPNPTSSTDASHHASTASSVSPSILLQGSPLTRHNYSRSVSQDWTTARLGRQVMNGVRRGSDVSVTDSVEKRKLDDSKQFAHSMIYRGRKYDDFEMNGHKEQRPIELYETISVDESHHQFQDSQRPVPNPKTPHFKNRWADETTDRDSDLDETASDSDRPKPDEEKKEEPSLGTIIG